MARTEQQFRDELAAARSGLQPTGHKLDDEKLDQDEGKLRCDFELPYSTMPKLCSEPWANPAGREAKGVSYRLDEV